MARWNRKTPKNSPSPAIDYQGNYFSVKILHCLQNNGNVIGEGMVGTREKLYIVSISLLIPGRSPAVSYDCWS